VKLAITIAIINNNLILGWVVRHRIDSATDTQALICNLSRCIIRKMRSSDKDAGKIKNTFLHCLWFYLEYASFSFIGDR